MKSSVYAPAMFAVAMAGVLTAATLSAQRPLSSPLRGLTVGVLGDDAVLVPVAVFDGRAWGSPWLTANLAADPVADPPATLRAIPSAWWGGWRPVVRWELLAADGKRHAIRVGGVVKGVECLSTAGLTTDFPPRIADLDPIPGLIQCPKTLAGMVSSLPSLLEPVSPLPLNGVDAVEIAGLLPSCDVKRRSYTS